MVSQSIEADCVILKPIPTESLHMLAYLKLHKYVYTHTHIFIYIYIYVCIHICICREKERH